MKEVKLDTATMKFLHVLSRLATSCNIGFHLLILEFYLLIHSFGESSNLKGNIDISFLARSTTIKLCSSTKMVMKGIGGGGRR